MGVEGRRLVNSFTLNLMMLQDTPETTEVHIVVVTDIWCRLTTHPTLLMEGIYSDLDGKVTICQFDDVRIISKTYLIIHHGYIS